MNNLLVEMNAVLSKNPVEILHLLFGESSENRRGFPLLFKNPDKHTSVMLRWVSGSEYASEFSKAAVNAPNCLADRENILVGQDATSVISVQDVSFNRTNAFLFHSNPPEVGGKENAIQSLELSTISAEKVLILNNSGVISSKIDVGHLGLSESSVVNSEVTAGELFLDGTAFKNVTVKAPGVLISAIDVRLNDADISIEPLDPALPASASISYSNGKHIVTDQVNVTGVVLNEKVTFII